MEPDQQQAFYKTIPAPMVNLIYQWLKELQPRQPGDDGVTRNPMAAAPADI